jgi:mannose-6-phosphate isomerase-like protein (cupin superfamily)
MPNVGDVVSLGGHERLKFTRLDEDLLEVEAEWDPGSADRRPLLHLHPGQDEHFVVHAGELTAEVGGEQRVLRAGDTLDVPRGTPHAMWNAGAEPVRATWQVRPALRTAQLWTAIDAVRRPGAATPTPEEGARLLEEYAPEFRLVL